MPRIVRNFWIELLVDGKQTRVETGPRSKDGGFQLTVMMRDRGNVRQAMRVVGFVSDDDLICEAYPIAQGDNRAVDVVTKR